MFQELLELPKKTENAFPLLYYQSLLTVVMAMELSPWWFAVCV